MKILYITDIHDALKELRVLLRTTEADIYLLCGDILYRAFYDDDKIYQFVCLQEEFYTLARKLNQKIYPFDLASDILRFPDKYEDRDVWEARSVEYRQLFEKATKTMKEKYEVIEDIIQKYNNGARCVVLPGNYDIDLRYTALKERDLHYKSDNIQQLKFAGYGGAPIATSGIPEKLAVVYHESQQDGKLFSEPEDFFAETTPDVMVIHNPAYGFFDRIPGLGHIGSLGIRSYLDNHQPSLVVSGHVHEDYGVCRRQNTILMNASNFGGVDSQYGWQNGGVYAELQLNQGQVTDIHLWQLINEEHVPLMRIENREEGLHGTIIQENRARASIDLSVFVRDSSGAPADTE